MCASSNLNVNSPEGQKPNIKDLTDTDLAQLFVNEHCAKDGDKDVAREALAVLIQRDLDRQRAKLDQAKELLQPNGGYFSTLKRLAERLVTR